MPKQKKDLEMLKKNLKDLKKNKKIEEGKELDKQVEEESNKMEKELLSEKPGEEYLDLTKQLEEPKEEELDQEINPPLNANQLSVILKDLNMRVTRVESTLYRLTGS